jgi:hypothetical protein
VKPRIPSAANNGPDNSFDSESARAAQGPADDDSAETQDSSNLLRRGVHHVRRGLNRAGVPKIAGHATRISRHGWRRISTAVAAANSGGRLSRPVNAIWGRVARRSDANAAGENPHQHRNRRLAFDFAVVTAVVAIYLVVHHQFRRSHLPAAATILAATSDVAPDPAAQEQRPDAVTHHRRRAHKSDRPADGAIAHSNDSHPVNPVAVADNHKDLGGIAFDDHADISHRTDHPVQPPSDAQVKAAPLDSQPHDSKQAADASLDALLSAPVSSGAPHGGNTSAPVAQTEPAPLHEIEKPARPHAADDPLLVDSRSPRDSALPPKQEPLKPSASAARLGNDFAAPEVRKPREHKDHDPKDLAKDDFAMPAPASSDSVGPPKEDEHHHKHHHPDQNATDPATSNDLAAPLNKDKDADLLAPKLDAPLPDAGHSNSSPPNSNPLNSNAPSSNTEPKPSTGSPPNAHDPLLDDGPKIDSSPKDAPIGPPLKPNDTKLDPQKADHPDDGLPVLSVPSPRQTDPKALDDSAKPSGPKVDDLGLPARTANANDAAPGGNLGDSNKDVPKPPETKAPAANDPGLDDLLNSKTPSSPSSANPAPAGPSAASNPVPESKLSSSPPPGGDSKGDPFHTDAAPHVDAPPKVDGPKSDLGLGPKTDLPPKINVPAKQAEPALPEISSPLPKPSSEPLHSAADEDSLPSVAVAHHQIEKDEAGGSVRYKIVVRNNGKKAVKAFEVDEAIPAEHTVQVTEPPAETRDRDLHWTLRDVGPGEERTIVVTLAPPVRPAERLPVNELAAQPIPAASVPIEARSEAPQVKLELITPLEVHAGESCRIGFRATNLGAKTTDLKLNLDLPDQLRYERGQQLQYKIGALGDHEAREDYLTATATGTGQAELRAQILQSGHSVTTAKGTCHVAPAGAAHRGIQQTGAWSAHPAGPPRSAEAADCLCWP